MELHYGRPDSMEGRLPREIRVYDYLYVLSISIYSDASFERGKPRCLM